MEIFVHIFLLAAARLIVVDAVVLVVAAALATEAEAAEGEGEDEGVEAVEEVCTQPDYVGGQLRGLFGILSLFSTYSHITCKFRPILNFKLYTYKRLPIKSRTTFCLRSERLRDSNLLATHTTPIF